MVKGPINIPIGPKKDIPPKTENKIKRGGKFILFPTMYGFKKLSISPTTITAQINRPIAPVILPVKKRNIIAGTDTRPVPTVGTKAVIIVTSPQRAGFGTPKKAKARPISMPWMIEIKIYPFIMPFTAWESLSMIFLSSTSDKGLNTNMTFFQ